jgi:hypothetical protein
MAAIQRFCNKAVYIQKGVMTHQGTSSEIADIYLEQNMESTQQSAGDGLPKQASGYSLSVKLLKQESNNVTIQFTYKSEHKDEKMYLGLSVVKDGISIAELNTMRNEPLLSSGKVTYNLDTTPFNGGLYSIGAGLFKLQNEELLSFTKERTPFIVKGSDATRGSALKLADTWKYE